MHHSYCIMVIRTVIFKQVMRFLIVVIVVFYFELPADAQWLHSNPNTTNDIVDISFPTPQTGYALDGNTGKLWFTNTGAAQWSMLNNVFLPYKIYFTSADTGFGFNGDGLFRTTDGGFTWDTSIANPNLLWNARPTFVSPQIGFVAQTNIMADSLLVYKTINGGDTWNMISAITDSIGFITEQIEFPDSQTGYIVNTMLNLCKTTDGGMHWSVVHSGQPVFGGISFVSADTGFAFDSQLYRTYNGGITWDSFPLPSTPYNGYIHFLNAHVGFISGGNGINAGFVMKTIDGGQNWILDYTDIYTYTKLEFPGDGVGYASGTGGSVIINENADYVIDNKRNSEEIKTFPNPFTASLNIQCSSSDRQAEIVIFSAIGNEMIHCEFTGKEKTLDMTGISDGIYFLSVRTKDMIWTKKIIKL